jgi:hypothetical protein
VGEIARDNEILISRQRDRRLEGILHIGHGQRKRPGSFAISAAPSQAGLAVLATEYPTAIRCLMLDALISERQHQVEATSSERR